MKIKPEIWGSVVFYIDWFTSGQDNRWGNFGNLVAQFNSGGDCQIRLDKSWVKHENVTGWAKSQNET